ncbi:YD repeat-containing protein, partial [Pseudovibrio denitrificans]
RSVEVTDALGHKASTHFDAHGNEVRRIKVRDGQQLITRMEYDALNQLTKVTDPAGSVWTYHYDGLGNQVTASDPNLGIWTKEYDGANRIIKQTDNKGQVTTYSYDKAGRTKTRKVGDASSLPQADPIMGTPANETLTGTPAADEIYGLAGSDKLYGHAGNDKLYGGTGNDTLYSGSGADLLDGGAGIDTANYSQSLNGILVNLGTGAASGGHADGDILINVEYVHGSRHDDVIIGNDGNNGLYAGGGNDHLVGGKGDDTLNAYASGADILDGGEGTDTVRYYYASSGVTVNLADPSQNTGDAAGDTYISIERIMGTRDHADTLIGDAGNNRLYGYAGGDTLDGGPGIDIVDYASSPTGVSVNLTTGVVSGGHAEGDTISNFEIVMGSNHDDVLIGDEQNNALYG